MNKLVFGKDDTENIVCVEPSGDKLILFKEKDGVVSTETRDNTFWILTNKRVSGKQEELSGDQHYKYMGKFSTFEEKNKIRQMLRKSYVDFWDIYDAKESSMVMNGITYFKGMTPSDVSILSFDIETTSLKHTKDAKVLLISNTFRRGNHVEKRLFSFDNYSSQRELTDAWCDWVYDKNPSFLCGHNVFSFDLPYLNFVSGGSLPLGRDGSDVEFSSYSSQFRVDGSKDMAYHRANIFGREIIDTMFLAYKHDIGRKYESYGLKKIIAQEGIEKPNRQFYDASLIRTNYLIPEEWRKIKEYAMDDADDALALFDLMCPAQFYFTRSVSKTFQQMCYTATGSQINNMMVRAYLQDGHSIPQADVPMGFEGAISFGITGRYKHTFKQDVASLYPSIMRQFKIYHPRKDPNKYFLELVEYFTIERLKNKKLGKETGTQYYKDLEQSEKIAINSMYGFMGAKGLAYNYPNGAAKVTRHGRSILTTAIEFATDKPLNYWLEKVEGNEIN